MLDNNYYNPKYFSQQIPEEDLPFEISPEISLKYSQLERLNDKYYSEDSLTIAKVNTNCLMKHIPYSQAQKKKEIKRVLLIHHLFMVKLY